jgi:hypothetical protein
MVWMPLHPYRQLQECKNALKGQFGYIPKNSKMWHCCSTQAVR